VRNGEDVLVESTKALHGEAMTMNTATKNSARLDVIFVDILLLLLLADC